jgi:hypothetical protein
MARLQVDPARLLALATTLEQLANRIDSETTVVHGAGVNAELAAGNRLAGGAIGGFAGGWAHTLDELGEISGPNGRRGTLLTIWQYDSGSDAPRLITDWLATHA